MQVKFKLNVCMNIDADMTNFVFSGQIYTTSICYALEGDANFFTN